MSVTRWRSAGLVVVLCAVAGGGWAQTALFQDTFARADAASPGIEWREYTLRGTTLTPKDSPWCLKQKALLYQGTCGAEVIADFLETFKAFPLANARVEFTLSGDSGPNVGWVGLTLVWLNDAAQRTSATRTTDTAGLLGFQTWFAVGSTRVHGWRMGAGKAEPFPDVKLTAPMPAQPVLHALTVKDNVLTYTIGDNTIATQPLDPAPPAGARRHLALGICQMDEGETLHVEIRNLKILDLTPPPPAPTPAPTPQ